MNSIDHPVVAVVGKTIHDCHDDPSFVTRVSKRINAKNLQYTDWSNDVVFKVEVRLNQLNGDDLRGEWNFPEWRLQERG